MTDEPGVLDRDLYERTKALLEPGDRELIGCLVHTDLDGQQDLEMQELTVEINDIIAEHTGHGEAFVYAGNDDPEFASNQFQGRTLDDESFVWECQQLLREGSFDLVFYYDAEADQAAICSAIESLGHDVTPVPGDEE